MQPLRCGNGQDRHCGLYSVPLNATTWLAALICIKSVAARAGVDPVGSFNMK
jgi:hypothetical protein